jgi:hypothetical protein
MNAVNQGLVIAASGFTQSHNSRRHGIDPRYKTNGVGLDCGNLTAELRRSEDEGMEDRSPFRAKACVLLLIEPGGGPSLG